MDVAESYHAHIYYNAATRPLAEALRSEMERLLPQAISGRWHDRPVGPHPSSMFQVAFAADMFNALVPWLILHHAPLTIFLHPNTGSALKDHTSHAVWMGVQRSLNLDALKDEA